MGDLEIFDLKRHGVLSRSEVETVRPVKIYYVFAGRNAWHSTWVQRYSNGCMHVSMQSAKNHAERLRTQGSVFNILELPAVAGISQAGAIIATQINTDRPLQTYSPNALSTEHPTAQLIEGALSNYLVHGAPMLGLALTFERDSRFWRSLPPRENSVFTLASRESELEFEALGDGELAQYTSRSNGGQYYLGWSRSLATVRHAGTEIFEFLRNPEGETTAAS